MGESSDPINSPQRREFPDHDARAQPDEDEGEPDEPEEACEPHAHLRAFKERVASSRKAKLIEA